MEVAWKESEEARNEEHQLLKEYENDHWELPPLNHNKGRLIKKMMEEYVHSMDSVVAEKREATGLSSSTAVIAAQTQAL